MLLACLPVTALAFAPAPDAVPLPAPAHPDVGTTWRFLGAPVDVGQARDSAEALDRAGRFVRDRTALLGPGVSPDDLDLRLVERGAGEWVVVYDRLLRGVPVEGATVSVRLRGGRAVAAHFATFPDLAVATDPKVEPRIDPVLDALPEGAWPEEVLGPDLVVVPLDDDTVHLAWRWELRTTGEPDWSLWYVDARTGDLVGRRPLVRRGYVGTLSAVVDDRQPQAGLVEVPLPGLDTEAGLTASDGSLDLADAWSDTVQMTGRAAWVRDYGGTSYTQAVQLSRDAPDVVIDATGSDQAELDAYVFTSNVRDRALGLDGGNGWASAAAPVNVNINSYCNAYFDGASINFYRDGGGCANTARIADVVYHEYGHGLHYYAVTTGYFDATLSEGGSDYLAATITGDPEIGPGFFSGGEGIREIETDRVYPRDLVGESHYDGLIFSGALWDLRSLLVERYGEGAGVRRADRLFYATLQHAHSMTDAYEEVLLAADDDGDLAHGVPDGCLIVEAFDAHGLMLGQAVTGLPVMTHEPPGTEVADDQGYPVEVRVETGDCSEPVSGVDVVLVRDDGTTEPYPLEREGTLWSGHLPAAAEHEALRYYFQAADGTTLGSAQDPFDLLGGLWSELSCQDFEGDWDGWTSGAASTDPLVRGLDEWEIGVPSGLGGDPDAAPSGAQVAGLDLGGAGDADGLYEPSLQTWLASPTLDLSGAEDVHLVFWSWLGTEDSAWDQARVRVNGEVAWSNERAGTGADLEARAWRFHDVALGSPGTVDLRFELDSDDARELGGWTLDRVCLVVPAAPGTNPDCPDITFTDRNGDCQPDDPRGGELAGCACGSAPARTPWWLGVLALLAVPSRRRR